MVVRAAAILAGAMLVACGGEHQGPGKVTDGGVPESVLAAQEARLSSARAAAGVVSEKQILFGDLHTHTTFSPDAFLMSLPLMGGTGTHPPADACDFARFCADLDFWSINDHAEGVSPRHWSETIDAIEQCNAVSAGAGEGGPDLVSFLGWEWTQVGETAAEHFGHKNVVLRETARGRVPRRPVAAPRPKFRAVELGFFATAALSLRDFPERQRYFDYRRYSQDLQAIPACPEGVDTRELPDDCHETAADPLALHEKLDQWGTPAIVIPHGTSWGLMTPRGFDIGQELAAGQHDADRQLLFEIYSGHGSAEPFRDWPGTGPTADLGVCEAPTEAFLPCCWRAGEIIRERCEAEAGADCDARATQARAHYMAAGAAGHLTIPGVTVADWLDCDQCRDCFDPAYSHRPGGSAQRALALTDARDADAPRRFRFGFIGSSDTHDARPGNGFKEFGRLENTEVAPFQAVMGDSRDPVASSEAVDFADVPTSGRRYMERVSSFFYTGGLAAVHAAGRDRAAIWDAMARREVYGTSGERILLWFDLLNGPAGAVPMGAEVAGFRGVPRFRAAAAGAFEQRPGCPAHVGEALAPERLASLCLGECYHPADRRRRITRIEIVRIRAQRELGDAVAPLVEDPWRTLACAEAGDGCAVEFDDPEFAALGGEVAYYARAIQEPTPAINAGGLRCTRDESGACIDVNPCYGDDRTAEDDDCLAPHEERAWSSPIFVQPAS